MKSLPDLDPEALGRLLSTESRPILLQLWAPWCGPCHAISPHISALAEDMVDAVAFVRLNVESHRDMAGRFNISGIPTLLLFDKGREIARSVGLIPKDAVRQWIDSSLAAPATG